MFTEKDRKPYIEWNFFVYWIKMVPNVWEKLSWLWFLLALFINSMINYPLIAWTQRRQKKIPIDWKVDVWPIVGICFSMLIWSLPNMMGPNNTGFTELVPMVAILLCYFLTLFFIQIPL